MQLQEEINDLASSPSFSYYFSDNSIAAKVSREFKQEQVAQFNELSYVDEEDLEFSMDELVSGKQIDHEDHRFVFPIFDNELFTNNDILVNIPVEEIDDASSFRIQIQKLFVDNVEESSSSSSSEAYESEGQTCGIFCMWRSKPSSTGSGSGSRGWRIRNLLRRRNGGGKESELLLSPKKVEASKHKRNVKSEEVNRVAEKLKTTSFHELFYVQKRAEHKGDKMKTFLPYRQDLLGFFVNINRIGNTHISF